MTDYDYGDRLRIAVTGITDYGDRITVTVHLIQSTHAIFPNGTIFANSAASSFFAIVVS